MGIGTRWSGKPLDGGLGVRTVCLRGQLSNGSVQRQVERLHRARNVGYSKDLGSVLLRWPLLYVLEYFPPL